METAKETGYWQLTIIMVVIASWLLYRYFGISLLIEGWREVYQARREGRLAADRLYGVVRHPQYTGIFLAIFGQLIHWPTIPTLVLFPFIVWAYIRLARREEGQMIARFGEEYLAYSRQVPRFVPRQGEWRRMLEETRSGGEVRP